MKIKKLNEGIKNVSKIILLETNFNGWEDDIDSGSANIGLSTYDDMFSKVDDTYMSSTNLTTSNRLKPVLDDKSSISTTACALSDYDDDFSPGEGELSTPMEDIPPQPLTLKDNALSDLIMDAIKDEYEAISFYNALTVSLKELGQAKYIQIVSDIANEEMVHVGQLQGLLKELSPNAFSIKDGEEEAQDHLTNIKNKENTSISLDVASVVPHEVGHFDVDDNYGGGIS